MKFTSLRTCFKYRFHLNRIKNKSTLCNYRQASRWSYYHGNSDVPLIGSTIGKLLETQTERTPDRTAVVCGVGEDSVRLTFEKLLERVDRFAAGLRKLGLNPGDRVGIWSPNCVEWIITQFASARAGVILVNINPAYQKDELEFALKKVGVKAVVAAEGFRGQNYYEMLCSIEPEIVTSTNCLKSSRFPMLKNIIFIGDGDNRGAARFKDIESSATDENVSSIKSFQDKIQFDDIANIQFTSGTTGNPKGACLSHHNLINNAYSVGHRLNYHKDHVSVCIPVPLYHTFGCVIGSLMCAAHGTTGVYPSPAFNPEASLQALSENKCESLYGTPTMFIDILRSYAELNPRHNYDLSRLHTGIMAGSPCPIEVMRQAIDTLNMKDISVCYGSTETSPVSFQSLLTDSLDSRVSTIGCVSQNTEAKVIDQDGNLVPVNTTGELCTRGYSTMIGYWEDPQKTNAVIDSSRWYRTGDLAILDANGYAQIVGRTKDMVIRGGENIYPFEIEQFLYKHPDISEVQVFGVPDKRLGEELCAWIKLKANSTITKDEIKNFCKGKISHFKIPKYIEFVEDFPMTVTLKMKKYKMRESMAKKLNLI